MAKYVPLTEAELNNDSSIFASFGAGLASGLIKTVEGIAKMLITRASIMNNDMIRIDTSVSSALNLPPDLDRIARAENFVEDGKIDARRD